MDRGVWQLQSKGCKSGHELAVKQQQRGLYDIWAIPMTLKTRLSEIEV